LKDYVCNRIVVMITDMYHEINSEVLCLLLVVLVMYWEL